MASDRAEPAAAGPGDPLSAREWIELLFDSASFDEQFEAIATPDPLQFEDSRPYAERVAEARERSGGDESVVTGTASVGGQGGSGDALGRSSSFRRGRLRRGNGWGGGSPPDSRDDAADPVEPASDDSSRGHLRAEVRGGAVRSSLARERLREQGT
jgi:hypothetical protein